MNLRHGAFNSASSRLPGRLSGMTSGAVLVSSDSNRRSRLKVNRASRSVQTDRSMTTECTLREDDEPLRVGGLELEIERRGRGTPCCCSMARKRWSSRRPSSTNSPGTTRCSSRPARLRRAPSGRTGSAARRHRLHLSRPGRKARAGQGAGDRLLASAAGSRRDGRQGRLASFPGWCWSTLRRQDRRARGSRHRGYLAAAPEEGDGAQMVRSGQGQARFPSMSEREADHRRAQRQILRALLLGALHAQSEAEAGSIASRCPTLFVWGENDGIVTPDYGRAYRRMIRARGW